MIPPLQRIWMAQVLMERDKSFTWKRRNTDEPIWSGKQVIVVGGTGGIGRAISRHLVSARAQVTVVGQTFRDVGVSGLTFLRADLTLMTEAARVAELLPAENADLLIFTAGIFAASQRQETPEGLERDLAVSYLNRFVILRAIADRLGKSRIKGAPKPRIFNMAYPGSGQLGNPDDLNSEMAYGAMSAHMNTVAANEALVLDAAIRYPHLSVFGLNPGFIKTGIRDNLFGKGSWKSRIMETLIGALTPTADEYAANIAPLLVSPDLEAHSGALFNRKGEPIRPSKGMTTQHVTRLIEASDEVLSRTGSTATL